ncbi:MAG: hypothetical protein HQL20_01725 [Candidatus Omnitrophica bacterium]|nr:hypothetical protein [Candidatus Omnitrophota bacterium]
MQEKKSEKKPVKKGFWAGLMDKMDQKMADMSCSGGCCSGKDKEKGSKCC